MSDLMKKWAEWIGLGILLVGAVFGIGYFIAMKVGIWSEQAGVNGEHAPSVVYAAIFGLSALLVLFVAAIVLGVQYEPAAQPGNGLSKPYRAFRNILLVLLGTLSGWTIAISFTPFGEYDAARIYSISQALTVFASGYLLSKFDRFLEQSLFGDGADNERWVLLGLFLGGLLAALLMTFTARVYGAEISPDTPTATFVAAPATTIKVGSTTIEITKENRISANGQALGVAQPGAEIRLFTGSRRVYVAGELVNEGKPYPDTPGASASAGAAQHPPAAQPTAAQNQPSRAGPITPPTTVPDNATVN